MDKKLNCILLIDDDEPTNFLHKLIIDDVNCTEKCIVVESGRGALDYLTSEDKTKHPPPDLIFLDINMPKMNGWEFLEHYQKLHENHQGGIIVVMLTTSLNPLDELRASKIENIDTFRTKPLTSEMLVEILHKHFPSLN